MYVQVRKGWNIDVNIVNPRESAGNKIIFAQFLLKDIFAPKIEADKIEYIELGS
jgi:hypothetical protein